jgi:hypothetical protein
LTGRLFDRPLQKDHAVLLTAFVVNGLNILGLIDSKDHHVGDSLIGGVILSVMAVFAVAAVRLLVRDAHRSARQESRCVPPPESGWWVPVPSAAPTGSTGIAKLLDPIRRTKGVVRWLLIAVYLYAALGLLLFLFMIVAVPICDASSGGSCM